MAIAAAEFVRMLRLWEQCCSDVGGGWQAASAELRALEQKAGVAFDVGYNDYEGFQAVVLRAMRVVAP